jgi:hypothetical protein
MTLLRPAKALGYAITHMLPAFYGKRFPANCLAIAGISPDEPYTMIRRLLWRDLSFLNYYNVSEITFLLSVL